MQPPAKNLTLSALFIALGVLIPILFHGLGLGSVFLPMFWPVAACPFFIPISYAIAVGALTPLVSTLLTSMPPLPILPKMVIELIVLGGLTAWLYRNTNWGVFWLVLIGLIASRIVNFLISAALAPILGLPSMWVAVGSTGKGFLGTIIMLIFIPFFINRLKKESIFKSRIENVKGTS